MTASTTYSVNLWGSRPGTADDCYTGDDYATRAEAEAAFADPWDVAKFDRAYYSGTELWIELDGPDAHDERCVQAASRRATRAVNDEWAREIAMEAGMAFGCDGYNDAMGY